MAHPRIFVGALESDTDGVTFTGPSLRHLRARRLRPGDHVVVFDGRGRESVAVLREIGRRAATATVESTAVVERDSPLALELAPAVLKGRRMDLVFEKGTELGVTRFRPLLTERVQGVRADAARWQRIVQAAAEQCGRAHVPAIDAPASLDEVLADRADAVVVVAFEGARDRPFAGTPERARRVVAISGPEGGLGEAEAAAARDAGAHLVGLGGRILRAETAAVVLAALAQHRWGDA